jgi:hypothetical protein
MATRRRRRVRAGYKRRKASRKGLGKHALAGKCKIVTIHGRRRKLCWNSCGAIVRNTSTSGGTGKRAGKKRRGAVKRRRTGGRRRSSTKGEFKIVSKKLALRANGRLKPGCRFTKNGQARCRVA